MPEVVRLHAENCGVFGRRKVHALLRRQGWDIDRDQTGRLMSIAGVRDVTRAKLVFTTRPDPTAENSQDLLDRAFIAPGPRQLWVADVNYVITRSSVDYVSVLTYVLSRWIVGCNVAATLRAGILLLWALADWAAGGRLEGVIHHADHGSN